jgi:carbon storage regulator CsrA
MLVLSRKVGERIVVPQCDLTVTVIAIRGKTVRLGISAPEDIRVYRKDATGQGTPKGRGIADREVATARGGRLPLPIGKWPDRKDHNGATIHE